MWWVAALMVAAAPWGTAAAQGSQRSAQGDCSRELSRRGYALVSTGGFEQVRDGWQIEVQARDHRGRVTKGTCFVETRSGDVSLYGFGWGGAGTVDRFEFTCASKDEKFRECQLPVDGRVRLVKRKSDAPCVEGRSWGQRGDRVWVDRGCRARFEVVRGGGGGGGSQSIECRSQDNRYRECAIRTGYEGRLQRDYTGRCRKDSTWGNRPGVIWVTSGCQGSFQLVRSGSGSAGGAGGGNSGQQQRAEVHCRNEATRQGITVRQVAPARLQGAYWLTRIDGELRGQGVRADCRYDPRSNRADLDIRSPK
jgi:hypothetical protein